MNTSGVVLAFWLGILIIYAASRYARSHQSRRPVRRRPRSRGPSRATDFPSEDKHWREHSERQARKHAAQRKKIWAAGTAVSLTAFTTGPHGGYVASGDNDDNGDNGDSGSCGDSGGGGSCSAGSCGSSGGGGGCGGGCGGG